jgi:O-antigen/teichoic acid export membrane protein
MANASAFQLQNIIFPIFYGLVNAGFYFLVLRVLHAPLSLISSSITDVYKQKLTDPKTELSHHKVLYKKLFIFSILIGIAPFLFFMKFGVDIFIFIFGEEWGIAGEYAIILAPMFFIKFVANPLSYFLYVYEKQEMDLIGQIFFVLATITSLFLTETVRDAIIYLSISFSVIYVFYLIYSAKLAGVFEGQKFHG